MLLKSKTVSNPNYESLLENTIKSFKILRNTRRRITFCKIVLPSKFNADEILNSAELIENYVCCFVLQPVFGVKIDEILKLQKRMLDIKDTRLIPQVHKYLGVK